MSLDVFAIAPPVRGLVHTGRGVPNKEKTEEASAGSGGGKGSRRVSREVPFFPHAEEAHTLEKAEVARQVPASLHPSPSRAGLGSHIDRKA